MSSVQSKPHSELLPVEQANPSSFEPVTNGNTHHDEDGDGVDEVPGQSKKGGRLLAT